MTADTSNELAITRVFDAPRELVYKAFADPDQLAQWFGPVGFTTPRDTVEIDARPGGRYRFVMVCDDGSYPDSAVDATFTEVVENELLVSEQAAEGIPGTDGITRMSLRLEFHDEPGGRTRLELRQGPYTDKLGSGAREGWGSSFTKLDSLLAKRSKRS